MSTEGQVWRRGYNIFKIEHNRVWQCINNFKTEFGFFTKANSVLNFEENKLSLLSYIGNERKIHRFNASFEFLLEYPVEYPGQYNHWIQSLNPMIEYYEDNSGTTKAKDFTPIHLNWTGFKGLALNSFDSCALDGNIGSFNWYYAIGDYKGEYKTKTPGPGGFVSHVVLWIRINPSKYFFRTVLCKSRNRTSIIGFLCVLICLSK